MRAHISHPNALSLNRGEPGFPRRGRRTTRRPRAKAELGKAVKRGSSLLIALCCRKIVAVKTAFRQRAIWISIIAGGMIFSGSRQCVAAQTAAGDTATSRIENTPPPAPASNVAVVPKRKIVDDPPTREPGTKKRVHYLASFGLI